MILAQLDKAKAIDDMDIPTLSVTKAMVFIIHDKGAPLSVPEKE